MQARPLVVSLSLAALVLGGCSATDEDVAEPKDNASKEVAETPTDETEEAAADEGDASEDETTAESDDGEDAASSRYGERIVSDRGNVVKELGQLAALAPDDRADEPGVEFTITAIEPNFECTAQFPQPAKNGNFIAVSVEIETFPLLAESEWPQFGLTPYDFYVISDDGVRENDSVGNSYSCLDSSEELPGNLGPAERAIGKIVLDSAHTSGHLVVTHMGSVNGWEWEF